MITFFRNDDCPPCDAVEETLREMSLAHKVVRLGTAGSPPDPVPHGITAPALVDGDERFEGIPKIHRHLEDLRRFKAEWDKFQSDACYCDDEGKVI